MPANTGIIAIYLQGAQGIVGGIGAWAAWS